MPPHKRIEADPGAERRVAMCRAAVAGDPRFGVSCVDVDRPGPSFSVDTLRALHGQAPGDDLTFIVGGDMAHSLPEWHEPEALLALAELGVAEREEVRRADILEQIAELAGARERVRFFSMPRIDISSSDIRERVAGGRPIRHLVPDAVAAEIAARGYYRPRAGSSVA